MTNFKPSDLVQRMGPLLSLPAALHKAELEQAAGLLICFCAENGDCWTEVPQKAFSDFLRAKLESTEWEAVLHNPFFRPDFSGLVEKGHAVRQYADDGRTSSIGLTRECIEQCAIALELSDTSHPEANQ